MFDEEKNEYINVAWDFGWVCSRRRLLLKLEPPDNF